MQKRGQITIFLLVGIVLLMLSAGIFYFVKTRVSEPLTTEGETTLSGLRLKPRITGFVENCLKEVAVPGIYLLGVQGGILYPKDPQSILLTENALINYGYLNGVPYFSLEKMEEDIGIYVADTFNTCLDDFSQFAKEGITFEKKKDSDVKTIIEDDKVIVQLSYAGEFTKGDDVLRIDSYSAEIPVRLGQLFAEAEKVVEQQRTDPTYLHLFTSPDYFVSYHPFDEHTLIYALSDDQSVIDGAPLTFMFAVRDESVNSPPTLDVVPDFVVRRGQMLEYEITAADPDNDLLRFSADQGVLDYNILSFLGDTPGSYPVTVKVEDTQGEKDEQTFRVIVE